MLLTHTQKAELLEILEIMCEKVEARIDFMHQNKEIPPDMADCISGIVYSADFLTNEVEYLSELKKQLINKYGKDYGKKCSQGDPSLLNPLFKAKFSATIPSGENVSLHLLNIATEFRIDSYLRAYATPALPPPPVATSLPPPVMNEDPGPYSVNRTLPLASSSNTQQLPPGTNPYYMIPSGPSPSAPLAHTTASSAGFTLLNNANLNGSVFGVGGANANASYPPPPEPQPQNNPASYSHALASTLTATFPPPLPGPPPQSLPNQDFFNAYPSVSPNTSMSGGGWTGGGGGGGDVGEGQRGNGNYPPPP